MGKIKHSIELDHYHEGLLRDIQMKTGYGIVDTIKQGLSTLNILVTQRQSGGKVVHIPVEHIPIQPQKINGKQKTRRTK